MACIISLIDPTKNKIVKTSTIDENYRDSEKKVEKLNNELNKKSNPKGLYWSVTTINAFAEGGNIKNKFDVEKLAKEFTEIDDEMWDLIQKSNSVATEGVGKESWEKYKELERMRFEKAKALFVGNEPDEMYDYIHDSILDDGADFPKGYTATIIASYYNSIMQYYKTIAVIKTPTNKEYLISVGTYAKVKIGTVYTSNNNSSNTFKHGGNILKGFEYSIGGL
jgi:hypothetical protein